MGLFDNIGGSLGNMLETAGAAALPSIIEKVFPNGVQGILDQLQAAGLGQQVNSWLGRGPNDPITVDDLSRALNDQQVRDTAERLGLPVDKLLELLAGHLPQAVDRQSPDGELLKP